MTVTYEHPRSGTVAQVSDTTDAQGNYQTSYVGNRSGDWFIYRTVRRHGSVPVAPETQPCIINSG